MKTTKGARHSLYVLIVAVTLSATPLFLFASQIEASITLSFILVSGLLCPALIFHASRQNFAMICAIVFLYLFMIIAPVIQLSNNPHHLINTLPLDASSAIYANIITSVFIVAFTLSYEKIKIPNIQTNHQHYPTTKNQYHLLFAIAIAAAFYAALSILSGSQHAAQNQETTIAEDLFKTKFLYTLPFVAFSAALARSRISTNKTSLIILLILLIAVFITKNPSIEKRNALGPVYLTILVLVFPWILSSGKTFFFFITAVVLVAFPLSSLVTHKSRDSETISFSPENIITTISNHFIELHYDAWANTVATVDYVRSNGYSLGEQALGTIFFYIPRSLWPEKPISTGELIGIHLTQNYRMWFDNLSAPIMAEGFIDFGIIGVIFYAIIFAVIAKITQKLTISKIPFHIVAGLYLTFSVFFIMRGSLMIASSYILAALCATLIVPRIISLLPLRIKKIRHQKSNHKQVVS